MKYLAEQYSEAIKWVRETASKLFVRLDRQPIDTAERVFEFARTRAALIAQKKLYGYLKERMGTRYPKMFDDDLFVQSINIAKMHVFAACLSDLTIHAVAHAAADSRLERATRREMAMLCYREGLAANADAAAEVSAPAAWLSAFEERLDSTHWENIAAGASAFVESPKALIMWAPIAPELKALDREIVENSMRFAWNEIRQDFRERLDAPAVIADWNARKGSALASGGPD
jgi:hypothetical protein